MSTFIHVAWEMLPFSAPCRKLLQVDKNLRIFSSDYLTQEHDEYNFVFVLLRQCFN